mmetsp:Transcript_12059/g.17942  ORF Transcript_12059/g.17942 Transcript_12059/m.17942 type:complete len:336 (-) Transcript_12059:114-1121(-)
MKNEFEIEMGWNEHESGDQFDFMMDNDQSFNNEPFLINNILDDSEAIQSDLGDIGYTNNNNQPIYPKPQQNMRRQYGGNLPQQSNLQQHGNAPTIFKNQIKNLFKLNHQQNKNNHNNAVQHMLMQQQLSQQYQQQQQQPHPSQMGHQSMPLANQNIPQPMVQQTVDQIPAVQINPTIKPNIHELYNKAEQLLSSSSAEGQHYADDMCDDKPRKKRKKYKNEEERKAALRERSRQNRVAEKNRRKMQDQHIEKLKQENAQLKQFIRTIFKPSRNRFGSIATAFQDNMINVAEQPRMKELTESVVGLIQPHAEKAQHFFGHPRRGPPSDFEMDNFQA